MNVVLMTRSPGFCLSFYFFIAFVATTSVLTFTLPVEAQWGTGTLVGSVRDETGGAIPGATVTVRNEATRFVRSVLTNDSGLYRILLLQPGSHLATAEMNGFKTVTYGSVEVTVGTTRSINFVLPIGSLSEVVNVSSKPAGVNIEDSQLSSLVDRLRVEELPLNGRDIHVLSTLQPGVLPVMQTVIQSGGPNSDSFVASGTRFRGNQFAVDGGHNTNDGISGLPVITPSVDMVQEFRVIRNNFSAEFGTHSGSIVNLVTKSGSNQFHGSIYEFHRNDSLDASGVFDPVDSTGKKETTALVQNQFGFTLGGPLVRDRLFFFGSYEGFRARRAVSRVATVETPEFRRFVEDNFPGGPAARVFALAPARAPGSDIVTTADILATGDPFLCFFCDPTLFPLDLPVRGNVKAAANQHTDQDQFSFRVDTSFNNGQTELFARYTVDDEIIEDPFAPRPAFMEVLENRSQQLTLTLKNVLTPELINEFRFTYLYDRSDNSSNLPQIPQMIIDGATTGLDFDRNIGGAFGFPQLFTEDAFQWQDVVAFALGRHFMRAGVDLRRVREDSDFPNGTRPGIVYQGLFDFAQDAPLGYAVGVDPSSGALASTPREFGSTEIGLFVQDDWKITPRLTLNLGLRWDYFSPPSENSGILSNISFPTGSGYFERLFNATVGPVDQLYASDLNNFAPRLGFAWDIFGDDQTSLRGGYGISYDKVFFNMVGNSRFNPPFFGLLSLSPFFGDDVTALPRIGSNPSDRFGGFLGEVVAQPLGPDERGGLEGLRLDLRTIDPKLRDSYVHNLFLGIQRELPWGTVLEVNYQGTLGRKLSFIGDPNRFSGDLLGAPDPLGANAGDPRRNRINPSFTNFGYRQNRITSNYHGLNTQLNKRFGDGLAFQVSYTYGKTLDYNSDVGRAGENNGGSGLTFVDPVNISLDYGRSNFDIRHRLVTNLLWELPSPTISVGLLKDVLTGWRINAILPIQSGLPFSVVHNGPFQAGGDFNADGNAFDRPDTPSFGNKFSRSRGTADFTGGLFKAADFPLPESGSDGDLGKNTYTGPSFWSFDMALLKNFKVPVNEGSHLQFRAEFFNLFNRVNLFLPEVDLNNSLFGTSVRAFRPREIQFALKLLF